MSLRDRHKKRMRPFGRRWLLILAQDNPNLRFEAAVHDLSVRRYVRRFSNAELMARLGRITGPT